MKRMLLLGLLAAVWLPAQENAAQKNDTSTAALRERYDALVKEQETACEEFTKAYEKAKSDAEREKLSYPSEQNYAPRFLKLAKEDPKSEVALDALVWIATKCHSGPEREESLGLLRTHHLQSEKLGEVARSMKYEHTEQAESWLRAVVAGTPHHEVKGLAAFSLGRVLRARAEYAQAIQRNPAKRQNFERSLGKATVEKLEKADAKELRHEAETIFEDLTKQYVDVKSFRGTVAAAGASELFEMRHLGIGQVAPDIEGEDVDGRKFKLSEYRGKVVVIDFWGDW